MTKSALRILHVNTVDLEGGAARSAWDLFYACRKAGYHSWLTVGFKQSVDSDVFLVADEKHNSWCKRLWLSTVEYFQPPHANVRVPGTIQRRFSVFLKHPIRVLERLIGIEDFRYPETWRLLQIPPKPPDIVHCHNLHGGYFDLRILPWLSSRVPVVLTLHDAWLLSGHCAHSFSCERWKTGCGNCPDLTIPPLIHRDATAYNWKRKRAIYEQSRLYVAAPSQWLLKEVEQSMLAPAVLEARVIPNGVNLSVFRPGDQSAAREALGVPQDTKVLLFSGGDARKNVFKDYQTLQSAVATAADSMDRLLLIVLGEDAPTERFGKAEIRFVPFQYDVEVIARYYRAADIYTHAARAETCSLSIAEALACGTPVIATNVGGTREQVNDLTLGHEVATGILVPPGNIEAFSNGIQCLLNDEPLRRRLGENAARDARLRFDFNRQFEAYREWYAAIVKGRDSNRGWRSNMSNAVN